MAFEMLSGQTVYIQRETIGDPYWHNGILLDGEVVITFETLTNCFVEPVDPSESEYLPTGLTLKDSRWLLCDHVLNTVRENNDNASLADTIYLSNPETGKKKVAYKVWEAEQWEEETSMELLDTTSYNYIIVKEGKV